MNCKHGDILLPMRDSLGHEYLEGKEAEIDVEFDGYHFTDINRLISYVINEFAWCSPDLDTPGIEEIEGMKHLIDILAERYK